LLGIIGGILDFSKVESGKMDIETIDFNVHDSVIETVKVMAVSARAKNLNWSMKSTPTCQNMSTATPRVCAKFW